MALQDGAQVHQQGALRLQRKAVAALLAAHQQVGGRGVKGIHVRLQGEDAQRSGGGVEVPGGVQHAQLLDLAPLVCQDAAARQGESIINGGVAQRDRQVGVVKGQVWKSLGCLGKQAWLLSCL